jgi:hypothetical protein
MNLKVTVSRRNTRLGATTLAAASAFGCIVAFAAFGVMSSIPAMAADTINGQVPGAGAPIVHGLRWRRNGGRDLWRGNRC